MSADTSDLSKVDSAVGGVDGGQPKKGRHSSSAPGVMNIDDLAKDETNIEISIETQRTGWKINKSSSAVDDPGVLKQPLTKPPVKKIDLQFPMGLEVTARNLKGVTIKDALDAIHKQFKKREDDELEEPYLAGFEWDPEISRTKLIVHLSKNPSSGMGGGSKKKKAKKDEGED